MSSQPTHCMMVTTAFVVLVTSLSIIKHPGSGQRLFHTLFIQLRVKFIISNMNDSNHHSNIKLVSEFSLVEGLANDDTNNIIFSPPRN
jgi:hypothetical protein